MLKVLDDANNEATPLDVVEAYFRPTQESLNSLIDFVDEKSVECLMESLKTDEDSKVDRNIEIDIATVMRQCLAIDGLLSTYMLKQLLLFLVGHLGTSGSSDR